MALKGPAFHKAHLAVLTANLLFGINFSVVKWIAPALIQPFGLNFLRVSSAVVLFWLLYMLKPTVWRIDRSDIPRFLLCALTGVAINQLLFIKGLTLTTPVHAALLILVTPVFILLIAIALKRETVTMGKAAGFVLGITGASLLILSKEQTAIAGNMPLGDLLVTVNAISYAFYFVLVKPLMLKYSALHVIRWVFTFGLLMVTPFCIGEVFTAHWSAFQPEHIAALLFVLLGATFFAYLFTAFGLQHLSPSATGSYIYLQPLFSAIISSMFFREALTFNKLLSAVFIFAGVYLVNYRKKNSESKSAGA
jgi:drug/metabolite transporter (DMT)-like permease